MKISINGLDVEFANRPNILEIVTVYSPYGDEPVAIVHNGVFYKSIDIDPDKVIISDNDKIDIVPLIIGG